MGVALEKQDFLVLVCLVLLLGGGAVWANFLPSSTLAPLEKEVWLDVRITGYSAEGGYDERTSLGYLPTWGIGAVDPETIPYGSILYAPHYAEMCGRYVLCVDCGAAVRGYDLDLWTETDAQSYALTGAYRARILRWGWDNWFVAPADWGLEGT